MVGGCVDCIDLVRDKSANTVINLRVLWKMADICTTLGTASFSKTTPFSSGMGREHHRRTRLSVIRDKWTSCDLLSVLMLGFGYFVVGPLQRNFAVSCRRRHSSKCPLVVLRNVDPLIQLSWQWKMCDFALLWCSTEWSVCIRLFQGPPQPGQPFKFTVGESCDRIKEEFNFLQAQYHR